MSSPDTPGRGFAMTRPSAPAGASSAGAPSAGATSALPGDARGGEVRASEARPSGARPAEPRPAESRSAGGRRARLSLRRVDPWSVMKLSFLLSIALAIVTVIAVAVLWYAVDALGVFTSVAEQLSDVSGGEFNLLEYTGRDRVLGVTVVLAAVNVVLMTALATLAAFLFNICTSLVGGLQVTLSDES